MAHNYVECTELYGYIMYISISMLFSYPNNDCDQFINWIWFTFLLTDILIVVINVGFISVIALCYDTFGPLWHLSNKAVASLS